MRLLLGSGGFRTEERIQFLVEHMRAFFGPIQRILFVPYALANHDQYMQGLTEKGIHAGYVLDGIHKYPDPCEAVGEAEGIFVGGGNSFRLLAELYRLNLLDAIRARVYAGMPYLGISAGCNVACPSIKTTNDMPITQPPSLDALGLVSFQINPHFFSGQMYVEKDGQYHEHFGETRDQRIAEFHEMNDTPVVGLWEAGILQVDQGEIVLHGQPARVFRQGIDPVDAQPVAVLSELLGN